MERKSLWEIRIAAKSLANVMSMAYTGKMLISFSFASGTCIHSGCFLSDCGIIMMQSFIFRMFSVLVFWSA